MVKEYTQCSYYYTSYINMRSTSKYLSSNENSDISMRKNKLCDVDEIQLKHLLTKSLSSTTGENLIKFKQHLKRMDKRNSGALSADDVYMELNQYKINIPDKYKHQLALKFASPQFQGKVEYSKMMEYLIDVKKLPVLDIPQLQTLAQNHYHRKQSTYNDSWQLNSGYLRQEELPILAELKRQLKSQMVNLATLYRHVNESDRERKGVLSKSQIEKILHKNEIHLTANLLDSILHYSDKDGYKLYDITKFLDYFDRAVREDRLLIGENTKSTRISRVKSPMPKPQLPVLETTVIAPTNLFLDKDDEEFDLEAPFDKNEWIRRFKSMSRAMYDSYQEFAGHLPREDVQHIAETYNLVYHLEMPTSFIGQSITHSFNHGNGQVDLAQFLSDLQKSCLRLEKFN